jgi:predicted nucleic-acid-binding Zn-ribbon protein
MSRHWQCPKCGYESYTTDQFRATGGMFAKLFDVQNKRFATISCNRCHYTELYRADTSDLENILDFFIGG